MTVSELERFLKKATRFETAIGGALHRVTAHLESGDQYVFEIDSARGWNATRVEYVVNGRVREHCDVELSRAGGDVWFPSRARMFRGDHLETSVDVLTANFDASQLPESFGPADTGVQVGMEYCLEGFGTAITMAPDGRSVLGDSLKWDGAGAMPLQEYFDKVRDGVLEPGPYVRAKMNGALTEQDKRLAQLQTSPGVVRSRLSWWRALVENFIQVHELDHDQVQAALACLRRAEERADDLLRRRQSQFDELAKERDSGDITMDEAKKRFAALIEPVDALLDQQLKPCLRKIPTRAQSQSAIAKLRKRPRPHLELQDIYPEAASQPAAP